jgi:3-oxoacyl-[acyl-carrier protein] reductase
MPAQRWAVRAALVTGVSRRRGIGFAIARRLLSDGYFVLTTGWSAHDAAQPWGADDKALVFDAPHGRHFHVEVDLTDPEASQRVIDLAWKTFARLDALVAVHARSSMQSLPQLTAKELDLCWAINVRATLLLIRAFAEKHETGSAGRVVLFTSGQHQNPMPDEIPYAVSKAAVHQMTATLAKALGGRGISVNTLNPGPTDTGWADPATYESVRKMMPLGRWNRPEDTAGVVALLLSEDAAAINGQVINL